MALKDIAKQHINAGSALREGREKIKLDDLVGQSITISEVDLAHGEEGDYYIVNFAEDRRVFFHTSTAITDFISKMIADESYGSLDAFNKALHAEGGLEVTIIKQKSKKGREYFTLAV